MRKSLEILRLKYEHGLSGRAIALSVCCALSTVQECLRRFGLSGLRWPLELDEAALEAKLYPAMVVLNGCEPDFASVAARLRSFKGITRERVWQEYRERYADGLSYSAFCAGFAKFMGEQKLVARQWHPPGSAMFVDYAGPSLFITDRQGGERRAVRVFVASLGFSHAIFAQASLTETTADWLDGHVQAFAYFGGVAAKVVPDNPKSLVQKSCRYEPELNPAYVELARHYGCAVVPARVRRPKDKAKVENAVLMVERGLFPDLLAQTFFDVASLNRALLAGLERLNAKPFQKRDGCRHSALLEERAALLPLPDRPYEYARWQRAKVALDYHVEVAQRYYSVPYALAGKTVDIRQSQQTVEIFVRGKRIASHLCLSQRGDYATVPEHRPDSHQVQDASALYKRGDAIGPATAMLLRRQVERKRHPDETLRSLRGIVRLAGEHGDVALESACDRALALGTLSYRALLGLLQQPAAAPAPAAKALHHEHVRGGAYFVGGESCSYTH
jgi:transposase